MDELFSMMLSVCNTSEEVFYDSKPRSNGGRYVFQNQFKIDSLSTGGQLRNTIIVAINMYLPSYLFGGVDRSLKLKIDF